MKHYYVYILTNKNNTVLYTGVTNDLLRRAYEHKNKFIDGFTKKYNLTKIVYAEDFTDVNDAIAAEKRIKGWLRAKKIKLIEAKNPRWEDLVSLLEENLFTKRQKGDPSSAKGGLRMTR